MKFHETEESSNENLNKKWGVIKNFVLGSEKLKNTVLLSKLTKVRVYISIYEHTDINYRNYKILASIVKIIAIKQTKP